MFLVSEFLVETEKEAEEEEAGSLMKEKVVLEGERCGAKRRKGLTKLEKFLIIYSLLSTVWFVHSWFTCTCNDSPLPSARVLSSGREGYDREWVKNNIIGAENFPKSSVTVPALYEKGFIQRKLCRGRNKTLCESKHFKHSAGMDTLHGDQVMYCPYELGDQPISVDQVCMVSGIYTSM